MSMYKNNAALRNWAVGDQYPLPEPQNAELTLNSTTLQILVNIIQKKSNTE